MEYLTEDILEKELIKIHPNYVFIRNKIVPNSGILNRPDFRNDELKLIYEFDGYLHYSSPKTILSDYKKYKIYKEMRYLVIRFPYFIQLPISNYPHGFIDKNVMLPAYFCELGIERFKDEIYKDFSFARKDIIKSLNNWINICGNKNLVIPPSLEYIL